MKFLSLSKNGYYLQFNLGSKSLLRRNNYANAFRLSIFNGARYVFAARARPIIFIITTHYKFQEISIYANSDGIVGNWRMYACVPVKSFNVQMTHYFHPQCTGPLLRLELLNNYRKTLSGGFSNLTDLLMRNGRNFNLIQGELHETTDWFKLRIKFNRNKSYLSQKKGHSITR